VAFFASTRQLPGRSRRHDLFAAAASLAYAALLFAVLSSLPVFGDAVGYSHRTADWIADSGMQLIPSGTERGAQGMGHPAAYFWIWALLMRIFGDTVQVAHLLPAFFTAMAVFSTWLLVSRLAGRAAGFWASVTLAASPLFLAQSLQPLQDIPFAAFAALSLRSYAKGRSLQASAWCAAAVVCREQALLLAACFIAAEVVYSGLRNPRKLLLYASPVLVLVVNGLANLAVNGFFMWNTYLGDSPGLPHGWLADRIRHFAGHLYAGDGRWILVTACLAAGLIRVSRSRLPAASALMLLSPALLFPPERLAWLAAAALGGLILLLRRGELPGRTGFVILLFPVLMVAFHVLVVLVSPDADLDLYRYLIGAYPAFLAGCYLLLRREGGAGAVHLAGGLAVLFTFLSGTVVRDWRYPDSTQAFLRLPYAERDMIRLAGSIGDTLLVPPADFDRFTDPALGYAENPLPTIALEPGMALSPGSPGYSVLIPLTESYIPDFFRDVVASVPEGFSLDTVAVWERGPLRLALLHMGSGQSSAGTLPAQSGPPGNAE
jgi:4-amino-4-deoxy-L-arabinose transferase-like glycosyltransferase